jgi:signal transduction histidine kinase
MRDAKRVSRALGPGAWEQGSWVWNLVFYLLLGASTVAAALGRSSTGELLEVLGLSLLLALWHWRLRAAVPLGADRPGPALLYLTVLVGLWFALAVINSAYLLMLFILYPLVFSRLRLRLAIPLALLLNVLTIGLNVVRSSSPLAEDWAPIGWGVLSAGLGIILAVWITRIVEQSAERRHLIDELQATREELAAAEREAGRLAERGRLARDIHDTLAQGFISIVLLLEAVEEALPPGAAGARARRHLEQALRTARENLDEARRLVWELRPEPLSDTPLGEALQRIARQLGEETGMAASATVTGTPRPVPADTEVALLRIAQEALANVRKHSGARRVALTLSYIEDEVALDVRDDGRGFDSGAVCAHPGGGFGLPAMRERVRELGGAFALETTPGGGTSVAVSVPLPAGQAPAAQTPSAPARVAEEVP